jgi:hypothetical protein
MKAISIRQPWAWLILHAGKDIENRDWPTKLRGRILVHASKGMTKAEYEYALDTAHAISRTHPFPHGLTMPAFSDLPRGGIVGSVEITDCVTDSESPWFFGHHGFVLRNPRQLDFVPFKGALGFFYVPGYSEAA